MTINLFRSNKSDSLVDSTSEQIRYFSVESDGTGDDLDRFISAITSIAQLQCEHCETYADVEALICQLPIDHLTFAAHDSLAPYSGSYPMALLVRAFITEKSSGWDETALHDYLRANSSFRRGRRFETFPDQSTLWHGWNHRCSTKLRDAGDRQMGGKEFIHMIERLIRWYRRRWGIENGFKKQKHFMVWTISTERDYRFFNFACVLYYVWRLMDRW